MRALRFRDAAALRVVLTSELCPTDVSSGAATVSREEDGSIILTPRRRLPKSVVTLLEMAGVTPSNKSGGYPVSCWAEALPLEMHRPEKLPSVVVFTTPTPGGLVDLSAELLRLGCERQELQAGEELGVVRAVDAPTYTIVKAADREGDLRVYAPDPPGQESVLTELGYRHPLASRLAAPASSLLLVDRTGWRVVSDRGWRSLDSAIELVAPKPPEDSAPSPEIERRRVELRLAPGRRETPSLWVIRRAGVSVIDRMLEYLPEEVVGRLTFAVTEDETIIVRARTSRHPPPDLSLDAEVYAPLAHLPDVYAPAGAIIEPPLRRERLVRVLGAAPGLVVWLAPERDPVKGPFRTERLADTAFAPMIDWAEYVIHRDAGSLTAWTRSVTFDFAPFVSTGIEWKDRRPPKKPPRVVRVMSSPVIEVAAVVAAMPSPEAPSPTPVPIPESTPPPERVEERIVQDSELAELERDFVAMDVEADHPDRLRLLERLGRAYRGRGRLVDSDLCLVRVAWEGSIEGWSYPEAELRAALETSDPSPDQVRAVAVGVASGVLRQDPHRLQRWLDARDDTLDVRTFWLSRLALSRAVGGDPLSLAAARDRVLRRLASGSSMGRELPSFLRFAGRHSALGNSMADQLRVALERLHERARTTSRRRAPTEPTPFANTTGAYVSLIVAYGFSRAGDPTRARALVATAREALGTRLANRMHSYLVSAYEERIEQAIAGLPPETPLSSELMAELTEIGRSDRTMRYKIDRLRESSTILEPLEELDASRAFREGTNRERDALRSLPEPERVAELERLAGRGERLADCLDLVLDLPPAAASGVLGSAVTAVERLPEAERSAQYARALVAASHFGHVELTASLLSRLQSTIHQAPDQLPRVLDRSLRALRRVGLRTEMIELLQVVEHGFSDKTPLAARLAVAGGLGHLGQTDRALALMDQGRARLDQLEDPEQRLALTRALARAYAQAPLERALEGIAELASQLRHVSDSFATNTHFCLSVLHFVESLVTGITSDDLALGEAGRRFVEDDEYLVRKRLHRDLG